MRKLLLLGVALMMGLMAGADEEVTRNTCYLTTSVSGSGKGCATTNAAWWAIGSESGTVLGEQGALPPPENDYVVRSSKQIIFQGGGSNFKCHSLKIGDLSTSTSTKGAIQSYTKEPTVEGELIGELGNCTAMNSGSGYRITADRLTITALRKSPFLLALRYGNSNWDIQAPVYGENGTAIGFGFKGASIGSYFGTNIVYVATNDWSHFMGTIVVTSLLARTETVFGTKLCLGAIELPGALSVGPESILELSGVGQVASLTLGNNTLLSFAAGASLAVTDSFTRQGVTHIAYTNTPPMNGLTNDVVLLTVPASATLDVADFVLDAEESLWSHLGREMLVKVDAETGVRSLCLRYPPMVYQTATDVATFNYSSDGVVYPNSMTNATHWSDGQLPHAGAHYIIMKRKGSSTYLRTPQQTDGVDDSKIDFTFPGESLTIAEGCRMTVFGAKFRTKQIYLLNGADIQNGQTHKPDIYANIHLPSGTAYLSAYAGNTMNIYGDVTGAAKLRLGSVSGSTSAPSGGEYFSNLNTNFLGTIDAGLRANKAKPTYASTYHTLNVADERNFGGRLAEFNPTALRVHGPYQRLTAKTNVTFTTNYNRGVYFYDIPVLNTAGYRMTFKTAVGVNGTLYKEGKGTLELGGSLAFAGATAATPTPGSNTLDIVEGTLAVSAVDAVNGLEIAFSNKTALVLAPNFSDSTFTRWGIRNVKTSTPFVVAEDATVSFGVESATPPTHGCTLGLLTVPNSAEALAVVRRLVGTPAKFFSGTSQSAVREIVDTEAGVVTLAVDIRLPGTTLLLR